MPTGIEWCDETFNPWWGCERVSPGCAHCYADTLANRFGQGLWGAGHGFRFFGDKHWADPLRWARTLPAKLGRRPRIHPRVPPERRVTFLSICSTATVTATGAAPSSDIGGSHPSLCPHRSARVRAAHRPVSPIRNLAHHTGSQPLAAADVLAARSPLHPPARIRGLAPSLDRLDRPPVDLRRRHAVHPTHLAVSRRHRPAVAVVTQGAAVPRLDPVASGRRPVGGRVGLREGVRAALTEVSTGWPGPLCHATGNRFQQVHLGELRRGA